MSSNIINPATYILYATRLCGINSRFTVKCLTTSEWPKQWNGEYVHSINRGSYHTFDGNDKQCLYNFCSPSSAQIWPISWGERFLQFTIKEFLTKWYNSYKKFSFNNKPSLLSIIYTNLFPWPIDSMIYAQGVSQPWFLSQEEPTH